MLFALGAVSSALDILQSLGASKSGSTASAGQTQGAAAANPFDPASGTQGQASAGVSSGFSVGNGGPSISPQTMSALIEAQSQSGAANTAPTDPFAALKDLFSQIDGNGDGSISKSEFESALGAGGTNIAAADDVFGKLDANGDGSVSLDELKSALQGAGHHGHHAMDVGDTDGSDDTASSDGSTDPLMQALAGASSTSVTNSDGSTTTSITYADGSKVTMTTPAASVSSASSSSGSATSSYNLVERMIQREAQSLSASLSQSLSVNV